MKRTNLVIFLLILTVATGLSIWLNSENKNNSADFPLQIAFTADTSGRIEPCGCFTGQYGGLTRVSSYLGTAHTPRLLYEIGDALIGNKDYHTIQYHYLLRAYGEMNYTAINLGHREAKLSALALREAAHKSPVPLISANLLDSSTQKTIVKPWIVSDLQNGESNLRIATIGVVDPIKMNGISGDGITIAPMAEVLRREIPLMQKKADLLICLAFTDNNGLRLLAEEFYEFTFILGGNVHQPSQNIEKLNRSWILSTTNQARALGEITALWKPGIKQVEEVSGKVALMNELIPQDPLVRAHSIQYRSDIRDIKLAIDTPGGDASQRVPGVQASSTYVGSQACAGCHQESFKIWEKSGHSHAFDALQQTQSDGDPSCIQCHTIGFGEHGGYLRSMGGNKLTNVGCESCHGPASEHIRLRSQQSPGEKLTLKMRPVGAGQCTQCHRGEFSRPFDWNEFWPLIQHGGKK